GLDANQYREVLETSAADLLSLVGPLEAVLVKHRDYDGRCDWCSGIGLQRYSSATVRAIETALEGRRARASPNGGRALTGGGPWIVRTTCSRPTWCGRFCTDTGPSSALRSISSMTASRFALTISSRPSMRPAETATPTHGRRRAHGRRTGQGVPARNPAPGESDEGGSMSELTTPIEATAQEMRYGRAADAAPLINPYREGSPA